jgi:hypothetical protein
MDTLQLYPCKQRIECPHPRSMYLPATRKFLALWASDPIVVQWIGDKTPAFQPLFSRTHA